VVQVWEPLQDTKLKAKVPKPKSRPTSSFGLSKATLAQSLDMQQIGLFDKAIALKQSFLVPQRNMLGPTRKGHPRSNNRDHI
jgi:hypothetical protein